MAAAAAAAASIAADWAWAMFDDTGMARVSVTDRRPRSSAEAETSTKEGITCLFLVATVTSGTVGRLLLSDEVELELLAPWAPRDWWRGCLSSLEE